jgi:GH25 family lysozyme M1 (1,4-beta-N-acetylmuramidase)
VDNQFENNYKGAKAAGIPVGAYHYGYAVSEAEARQEARFFLDTIKGKQFEYPSITTWRTMERWARSPGRL